MCDYIVTFYSEHRQVLTTVIVREEVGLIDDVVCEMALKQLPNKMQKKFCGQSRQRYSVRKYRISGVA